jgi:hypothetical protein
MAKVSSSVIRNYNYAWAHHATYRVKGGIHIANMRSTYYCEVNSGYHAWVFDLRGLSNVDMVEFRVTSDKGEWLGRVPRNRLARKIASIACDAQGNLLLGRRYSAFFKRVA